MLLEQFTTWPALWFERAERQGQVTALHFRFTDALLIVPTDILGDPVPTRQTAWIQAHVR